MNTRLVAILASVVVVIAVVCGVALALNNGGGDKNTSDYTLLDSEDKIVKGLKIKGEMRQGIQYESSEFYVTSVNNGTVKYDVKAYEEGDMTKVSMPVSEDLDKFKPTGGTFDFDYTSSDLPSGIKVTKSGDTYTINGKYAPYKDYYEEYDDLKITYASGKVTDVSGKMEGETFGIFISLDLSTKDGKLTGTAVESMETNNSNSAVEFYPTCLEEYNSHTYSKCEVTESKKDYGNVEASVYTVNGKAYNGDEYKDYAIYVYKGYIIHSEGYVNGDKAEIDLTIYID